MELSDLIVPSFGLMTMRSRTVTGVSKDSVALGKKQFLSAGKGHWHLFLFLYSTGHFYLVLPRSWLHVCIADLCNSVVHCTYTAYFRYCLWKHLLPLFKEVQLCCHLFDFRSPLIPPALPQFPWNSKPDSCPDFNLLVNLKFLAPPQAYPKHKELSTFYL